LPVVVAIGHEQDRSVLDSVARSCKTPTAAAGLLVDAVGDGLERIETLGREILELVTRGLREQRATETERARRLARATRALLDQERVALGHRRRRAVIGARSRVAGARERLARDSGLVPRAADRLIEGQRQSLRSTTRSLLHGARRDVTALRATLERLAVGLTPAAHRRVRNERERLEARDHRVQLVHPRKVIERGYSILRLVDGRLLTEADMAPPGSEVRAELKQGALRLRSEGATDPRGKR
jgi:exodeoxyribonuclease VII large subunit